MTSKAFSTDYLWLLMTIGRSVRSTTASVLQIPTTTTTTPTPPPIIQNRREMREVL